MESSIMCNSFIVYFNRNHAYIYILSYFDIDIMRDLLSFFISIILKQEKQKGDYL